MIKNRKKQEIENYGNKADADNPKARKNFKSILITFNEFEFNQLGKGAEMSGRNKVDFMRQTMLNTVDEMAKSMIR